MLACLVPTDLKPPGCHFQERHCCEDEIEKQPKAFAWLE
jgi:hypothetical protein